MSKLTKDQLIKKVSELEKSNASYKDNIDERIEDLDAAMVLFKYSESTAKFHPVTLTAENMVQGLISIIEAKEFDNDALNKDLEAAQTLFQPIESKSNPCPMPLTAENMVDVLICMINIRDSDIKECEKDNSKYIFDIKLLNKKVWERNELIEKSAGVIDYLQKLRDSERDDKNIIKAADKS